MITFYATLSVGEVRQDMLPVPVLLPASSWCDDRGRLRAPRLPLHVEERAADSGGFVATLRWGAYRYSLQQYVDWLCTFSPRWAATMDFCCEPEIAGDRRALRQRQAKTTQMALEFFQGWRYLPWCWVPTVQGWEVEDYQRHAQELKPLVEEMWAFYGHDSAFRVGIGTLCRRARVPMIRAVVGAVAEILPQVPLHLWGVKLGAIKMPVALPSLASCDSAAWNGRFGRDIERCRRSGLSQRQFIHQVSMPEYQAKVARALEAPKQTMLAAGLPANLPEACPGCGSDWQAIRFYLDEEEYSDVLQYLKWGVCPCCGGLLR